MKRRTWFLLSCAVLSGCSGGDVDTTPGCDASTTAPDGAHATDTDGSVDDVAKDVVLSESPDAPPASADASMPTDSSTPRDSTTADSGTPNDSTILDTSVSNDSTNGDSGGPVDSKTTDSGMPDDSTDSDDGTPNDGTPNDGAPTDSTPPQDSTPDGDAGSVDVTPNPHRIPPPCNAPLPTGFCLVSDPGDYIGGGKSYTAGAGSVTISGTENVPTLHLVSNIDGGTKSWDAQFAPKDGDDLVPALYDPAQRYPFNSPMAGISVSGNGSGCNTITGRFAVEELGSSPQGGTNRISVTFEQHCEGAVPALRGVINFQATGNPDPPTVGTKTIALSGKIFRVAYDAVNNIAYGLDATNRQISTINLSTRSVTTTPVVQVPNDGCVDVARGRLFVVNKGSAIISEYKLSDLTTAREITWAGADYGATTTHFQIYCAPDQLYVVDGAWAPALFTVEDLDAPTPTVTNHTAQVAGVGGLVLNSTSSDLYYWYQYGWGAGTTNTYVRRLATSGLTQTDQTTTTTSQGFVRDPLDAPVLLDETRGLVFSKNCIFDLLNLTRRIFTLPGPVDQINGAQENTYALNAASGRIATRRYVYELSRYDVTSRTLTRRADQMFFDRDGLLWFLTTSKNVLEAQAVP